MIKYPKSRKIGRNAMCIYEKIFDRLEALNMSQLELSRRTGIATSTISDWRKKKINPQADKILPICKALDMSLMDLLCEDENENKNVAVDYVDEEKVIIDRIMNSSSDVKRRIFGYCERLLFQNDKEFSKRNVSVIQDEDGRNIVVINDIRFKGKRSVNWKDVREYLKEYVGEFYTIAETKDVVFIGTDLPREYSGSKYTHCLKGANAKAKANAAVGLPKLIEIATDGRFRANREDKHKRDAKNGWYKYDSRFALPVYDDNGELDRYNIFHASMLIRHSNDGKRYLYDVIDIKKETSNSLSE